MHVNPFVSVLLPVYNGEQYISSAISSVLNQDDMDLELIVSIDSSSDASERIADSYAEIHPNVKVYSHPQRLGMRGNYEFLIEMAEGSWLTILGQDDAMMPFAISELRKSISKVRDIQSLVSRRAYAFWPDTEGKFGKHQFIYAMGRNHASQVNAKSFLRDCLVGKCEYSQGPQLYTGSFVSSELVKRIRMKQNGELFPYPIPDVSSSASILLETNTFHYSDLPLFIVGTSGSSTGVLIDKAIENQVQDEDLIDETYLESFNGKGIDFDIPGLGMFSNFSWYLFEAVGKLSSDKKFQLDEFNFAWILAALRVENPRAKRIRPEFKSIFEQQKSLYGLGSWPIYWRVLCVRLFKIEIQFKKFASGLQLFMNNRLVLEKFDGNLQLLNSIKKISDKRKLRK